MPCSVSLLAVSMHEILYAIAFGQPCVFKRHSSCLTVSFNLCRTRKCMVDPSFHYLAVYTRKPLVNGGLITKGSLLAGYVEFYFAKQRGALSLNYQEKGTPPLPPSKGTLAICLVSLFTQQPLRSVSSSSPSSSTTSSSWWSSSSSSSPSSFDLKFGFFRHPFAKYPTVRWKWQVRASIGTAKRDIIVCANTDCVFFPAQCVCLTMYTSKWLFKWTKWWATMDIVGCSLFGSRYLRSALNVQLHAPPQVNSRHMPCASLHATALSQCLIISIILLILIIIIITTIIIIIIIIRLAIRVFRHPFATYPTVRWKWQVRASIGTAKATLGFVLPLTVFFFLHDACVRQYTSMAL